MKPPDNPTSPALEGSAVVGLGVGFSGLGFWLGVMVGNNVGSWLGLVLGIGLGL